MTFLAELAKKEDRCLDQGKTGTQEKKKGSELANVVVDGAPILWKSNAVNIHSLIAFNPRIHGNTRIVYNFLLCYLSKFTKLPDRPTIYFPTFRWVKFAIFGLFRKYDIDVGDRAISKINFRAESRNGITLHFQQNFDRKVICIQN